MAKGLRDLYGWAPEPVTGRAGPLVELYAPALEMARPAGSYGQPLKAMLSWASQRQGQEFTMKDLFKAFRAAGGQPNQTDDNKAYMSFQTSVRNLVDQNGRGTPERPLVITQAGRRGRGGVAVLKWGPVRPSTTAARKPEPAADEPDDMELGPAGPTDYKTEPPGPAEPGEEPGEEPEPTGPQDEDDFDWIPPTGDPDEPGVRGAMARLREGDPDKLEQLLVAASQAEDTDEAGMEAIKIFGRGKSMTRDAILVAKEVVKTFGRPDMG